jgi:hypothetical protein
MVIVRVCVFDKKRKEKKEGKNKKLMYLFYSEPLNLAVIDLLYFLYKQN